MFSKRKITGQRNILLRKKGERISGLYIGSKYVDLMQVENTPAGARLIGFAREQIAEGREGKGDFVFQAVKRVIRKSNLRVDEVVVNLPLESSIVRYLQMPLIPEGEWKTAIKFEAKRHIPFSMENIYFDFYVVKREAEKRMEVVFVAAQKKEVDRIISELGQIKLRVFALEPLCSSAERILRASNQINPQQSTMLINLVQDVANVNILKDNVFYFVRDIKITSEDKDSLSFDNLISEIRFCFNYYEKRLKQERIEKIVLSSDERIDSALMDKLKENFRTEIEMVDPARGLEDAKGLGAEFCFSAGLALKGITRSSLEVNLWQQEELVKKRALERQRFVKTIISEGVLGGLILGGVFFITQTQINTAKRELEEVKSRRPKVSAQIRNLDISRLKAQRRRLKKEKAVLKNLMDKRIFLTTKLNEINKLFPENAWIRELSWREEPLYLVIKGSIFLGDKEKERETITNFASALSKNEKLIEGFERVEMKSLSEGREKGYRITDFEIEMR
ncbi:MAG: hypothetical protein DRP75_02670 [Candidatus Omnitrophota bacterium]|nr:MAG: hypothetical protein DRP75_02670 [Candidatus Omnitrophota bacterium]